MRLARLALLAVLVLAASCTAPRREEPSLRATSALGWGGGALDPIRIRTGHTATLLGTGEVLVAGGGATPRSTELLRPFDGKAILGPDLSVARTDHTATMLLSGKVLLAGGGTAAAELYDPITRTFTPTGALSQARTSHVAVRLRSGRVLVTGGAGDTTSELYDPATGTWSAGPARRGTAVQAMATLADGRVVVAAAAIPTTEVFDEAVDGTSSWAIVTQGFPQAGLDRTLTRIADGRVVSGVTPACVRVGDFTSCSSFTNVMDAAATTTVDGPDFFLGRNGFTAVRAGGDVLFIGGDPNARRVEAFTPLAGVTLANDGDLTSTHGGATSTLLPGGDIVVIGGVQAALDRRVTTGAWALRTYYLQHARESHMAARLHDGRVLVAGGENVIASFPTSRTPVLAAEIVDPASTTTTALAGPLAGPHLRGTLTTLRSGKVLVAGGGTASVELYTPGAGFTPAPPMASARTLHSATLLPSGKVLVVGGTPEASAELFDPTTAAWSALPAPVTKWSGHGAVLLPNGLVLLVGGGAAELFDPVKGAFRATTPPGASRDGRSAHLLPNGKVFVAGGRTLAAELFDPATETWSYSAGLTEAARDRTWTARPDGQLVATGGRAEIEGVLPAHEVFDALAHPTGTVTDLPTKAHKTYFEASALSGSGQIAVTGGAPCFHDCAGGDSSNAISIYSDDAPEVLRPTLTDVRSEVTAGTRVPLAGSGFANGAEASDGTRGSSASNHPVALWVSDAGDAVVPGTIADFTDTTATWIVPTTALYGHGQLFVSVAGVLSRGRSVTILPALAATGCLNDAQCGTGFCVDGVCCDTRCDGLCEGCSAARKTSGADGVCGAVPPGKDITGRCVLKLGEACAAPSECGTGFCASGVCCDSTCEGQCLSCNQEGKAGRCSAINEGACGAACDGDHTLKQIGVPDVDCTPYTCGGPQCNQTCASARDCVAPSVCDLESHCVPGVTPAPGSDVVCGCRAVGAPSPSVAPFALAALATLALRRRRR